MPASLPDVVGAVGTESTKPSYCMFGSVALAFVLLLEVWQLEGMTSNMVLVQHSPLWWCEALGARGHLEITGH